MRVNWIATIVGTIVAVGIGVWILKSRTPREPVPATTSDLALAKKTAREGGKKGGTTIVAVEAALVRAATISTDIRAIGSLQSDESVQIASEIAGRIAEITFAEGQTVRKGDVLVKLDDALAQAEVADAKARFDLAEANNQRASQLSRSGNVSEKAIDEATAAFETARVAMELQRVRLAKHTITAPFTGRIGFRTVSPGAYIGVGTSIVNLERIKVLKVGFKLPELFLPSVNVGGKVDVTVDALPGKIFTGEIYAIDPQVDVNGRALQLRAKLANDDFVLRPGLFARILVKGKQTREVALAPESAIVPRGGETFVFKIENGRAVETKVKLGERKGAEVEIVEGLLPNTQVVIAGQLKLRNGLAVEIVDAGRPAPPVRRDGT
jgi:membrane fusion protein (multidrug efflux system)